LLTELSIRDLALIPRLRVRFGPGLNVLSGETGAGKSLVVGSLRLLCGERPPPDIVRTGEHRAVVEGIFELEPGGWIVRELAELGIDVEDGELILRREIVNEGRGRVRANGNAITLGTLARASELLVDLHGQHDHQSLLRPSYQLDALDDYAGLLETRDAFAAELGAWRQAAEELGKLREADREEHERAELARFQLRELTEAAPREGELAELIAELGRLERASTLRATAARLEETLAEADGSIRDVLSECAAAADEAASHDPEWQPVADTLQSLAIAAGEAANDARVHGERAVDDPVRLSEVRDRVRLLQDLLRKYGPGEAELLAFWERLRGDAEDPEARQRRLGALEAQVAEISDKLSRSGAALTRKRKTAAAKLRKAVEAALAELGMEGTRFEAHVSARRQGVAFRGDASPERGGRRGVDEVELLLAPNRGEERRPLRTIASGGEISRVMLALKSVLGETHGTATMAFDEIDHGVGGRVAAKVGDVLAAIAESRQVICITHLAAIASRASVHLCVAKREEDGRTVSSVDPVDGEERVREVARMLGGDGPEGVAAEHARELLRGVGS
jgi:DNA repair protein RecN (Recombination protein N)